jgi:ribonuclease R
MSKAAYDISNIGHYGLGFSHYAHFTSPIRRYADLLVHRSIFDELNGVKPKHGNDLRETCKHISKTERQSIEAERNSTKYFQVIFVRDSIGEEFEGTITGLTEWGMYVEMNDNKCEGMVSLKEISGDTYVFDNEKYVVKGMNYGDEYNMGDSVKVILRKVNVRKRQIDLDMVS